MEEEKQGAKRVLKCGKGGYVDRGKATKVRGIGDVEGRGGEVRV